MFRYDDHAISHNHYHARLPKAPSEYLWKMSVKPCSNMLKGRRTSNQVKLISTKSGTYFTLCFTDDAESDDEKSKEVKRVNTKSGKIVFSIISMMKVASTF